MRPRRASRGVAALALAIALAACGKKGPLLLPGERAPEDAPALAARVRERSVILDFRVPRERFFPERQSRWVLARVLRQSPPSTETVEAGAILEARGFDYGARLSYTDAGREPRRALVYRVEFRDAERKRRALTAPLAVSWSQVPAPVPGLVAAGLEQAVSLRWEAPDAAPAGLRYRVYRRPQDGAPSPASPEPLVPTAFIDTGVEAGKSYCYAVRGVLDAGGIEVEGPAGAEACAAVVRAGLPPREPPPAPR